LDPVGRARLAEQVRDMGADSLLADEEVTGDLAVGATRDHVVKDLALASRQPGNLVLCGGCGPGRTDSAQRDACGAGERDDLAQQRLGPELLRAGVRPTQEGRRLLA